MFWKNSSLPTRNLECKRTVLVVPRKLKCFSVLGRPLKLSKKRQRRFSFRQRTIVWVSLPNVLLYSCRNLFSGCMTLESLPRMEDFIQKRKSTNILFPAHATKTLRFIFKGWILRAENEHLKRLSSKGSNMNFRSYLVSFAIRTSKNILRQELSIGYMIDAIFRLFHIRINFNGKVGQ